MTYIAKPKLHHPALQTNAVGFTRRDYEGRISTLCAGCGHDSISASIIQACWELSIEPHRVAKLSGIAELVVVGLLTGYVPPDPALALGYLCGQALVMLGRKNGKTTIASALALYMLFSDREPGAEILSAACDSDQAALAFDIAKQMVLASPILSGKCKVYRRHIEARRGAVYKVIAADAAGNLGHNISTLIFDELLTQKNRDLYESLVTSMGARTEPLAFMISTAGHDRGTLCYELYSYAKQVREGVVIDPTFLPVIYEAPRQIDWKSSEAWKAANPGLGKSVTLEYLKDTCQQAQNNPAREQSFRQYHLNQWVDSAARWRSAGPPS